MGCFYSYLDNHNKKKDNLYIRLVDEYTPSRSSITIHDCQPPYNPEYYRYPPYEPEMHSY